MLTTYFDSVALVPGCFRHQFVLSSQSQQLNLSHQSINPFTVCTINNPPSPNMACPWLPLSTIFLAYGAGCNHEPGEHKPLYEPYPSNPNAPPSHRESSRDKSSTHAHSSSLASSSKPRFFPPAVNELAKLPFFRTVIIRNASSIQTPVLDNLRILYLVLGQFDIEYIARFEDIPPIFVVCGSPKAAGLVLQFLPGITRDSGEGFIGEIYNLTSCLLQSCDKVEAWSCVSLWVSIEEKDLRLRVRAVDDPFRGFQDLSWQFQTNCHHRSGENDHDKEGEVTLWVETSGVRKDFTMPSGKGRRSDRIQLNLETQIIDGAIETIQSGIQNRLYEGRVVVGLRLVFTNVLDSKELKRWLVSPLAVRNDVNEDGRECEYPPAFQVSAMRRSQIPPPSWSSPVVVGGQIKSALSHACDSAVGDSSQDTNLPSHENSCQNYYSETVGSQYITPTAHHYQNPVASRNSAVCDTIIAEATADNFTADWIPRTYNI